MKKEYIRTEELKELLLLIPMLKSMKRSLDVELQRCINFVNDEDMTVIEGMTFGNCRLSDMPFANTNETSDKTSDIALNYEKQICSEAKEAKKAIKEIIREIYYIEVIIDKIEIGLGSVGKVQNEIIKLKYWENKTWDEIMEHLREQKIFYSKVGIRKKTKQTIKKINTIALIDLEMYKNIKALINNTNL